MAVLVAVTALSADTMSVRRLLPISEDCPSSPLLAGRARQAREFRNVDGRRLITDTPDALLACFYRADDQRDDAPILEAGSTVAQRDIPRVVGLTRAPFRLGDHGCPTPSFERQLLLIARYSGAPELRVSIRYVCGTATNGSLVGAFVSSATDRELLRMFHRR
ncbi:hypothetical protein [Actinoallomurus acanthiterrae]